MQTQHDQVMMPDEHITDHLFHDTLQLLKDLIATPSFSGEESFTATLIQCFLQNRGVQTHRMLHNIWAFNYYYDPAKPTILLNSHHDTVKPNNQYQRDPFQPAVVGNKLYGLGSNDAGGCLVSLLATFLHFYSRTDLAFNLCYAATAEEENSGDNGLKLVLPELGHLDFAIVGEPTLMNMAIAERGLMVLDCLAIGKAGHAAREEGNNAIYICIKDIDWFRNFSFPNVSDTLGPIKMSVTVINAGTQHNVVPGTCSFTVDIRLTDAYTYDEVLNIVRKQVSSEVTPRSFYLNPSVIDISHPLVQAGLMAGCKTYGSPTTSDQALLNIPSVKLGPGSSARSHMPDEYIFISEIQQGIKTYTSILELLVLNLINNHVEEMY
ncbi:M20 family metallo-hydrolase [Mucilaginibacter sp. X4EP1]|uniref:M20 family metallo-hydrolase n=1 Tax=Mucilaginibacter sp. X4EP1 TaxID=2723092 RepID=UPI0038F694EE|nr:acetylornithine deacetylase [Mucilaginibacter sp. X4EP1]